MPDRDARGWYVKGNPGGPGRKPRKTEDRYIDIMAENVTEDDWRAVTLKAVEKAKKGDAIARKWLSDYLIGAPTQRIDMAHSGRIELLWDWEIPPDL